MNYTKEQIETLQGYYGADNLQAINFEYFIKLEKKQIIAARKDGVSKSNSLGAAMDSHELYYKKLQKKEYVITAGGAIHGE